MLSIVLFLGAAVIATLPSVGIASIYLRRRAIDPAGNTVQTFMRVAPAPLKIALVAFNFVNFAIIAAAAWYALRALGG